MSLVFAQPSTFMMGARPMALGNVSSISKDPWSSFSNPSGLAEIDRPLISTSYLIHPYLESLNSAAAAIVLPTKILVAGLGAHRFGDDVFNQQILAASIANKFGIASLGLRCAVIQYQAEGYGTRSVVTVSFGGIAQLTPVIGVGALITNINQPVISSDSKETVPTKAALALLLSPSENIRLVTEVEKDLDYPVTSKCGFEYERKKFALRGGFNINPDAAFFGTGFKNRKLGIDLAIAYNLKFGVSSQASLSYFFQSK